MTWGQSEVAFARALILESKNNGERREGGKERQSSWEAVEKGYRRNMGNKAGFVAFNCLASTLLRASGVQWSARLVPDITDDGYFGALRFLHLQFSLCVLLEAWGRKMHTLYC